MYLVDLALIKQYTISWLDPVNTEYDTLIDNSIVSVQSFINELIGWRHVPIEITFQAMYSIEKDNKIYLDKLPVNTINSVVGEDGVITNYHTDRKYGIIHIGCQDIQKCWHEQDVIVNYTVGGICEFYPDAINNIIIDLVLMALFH